MRDAKLTLFSLSSATLISLTVFLAIIFKVDPNYSDMLNKAAFFASLFLTLTGIITFILIYLASLTLDENIQNILSGSILHASLISLMIIFCLILRSMDVFDWWEFIIVMLIFISIELLLKYNQSI